MEQHIIDIKSDDRFMQEKMDRLLQKSGLRRDAILDHSVGIVDDDYRLLAVGSCAGNTLRCIAVDEEHRGEGLLNTLISRLTEIQVQRGNTHVFVYTKLQSASFFESIGYKSIAEVDGKLVFMENRAEGFQNYLEGLGSARSENSVAVVMNANPFTLGHRYLLEQAASEGFVHLFVVEENLSEFPFELRYELVKEGCADIPNVAVHSTGAYMISSATFPEYFLKSDENIAQIQARLDAEVFSRIAAHLNIRKRFFGQEPFSPTTETYNNVMLDTLPQKGIEVKIIPRLETGGLVISASAVRAALKNGDVPLLESMLPSGTMRRIMPWLNGNGKL